MSEGPTRAGLNLIAVDCGAELQGGTRPHGQPPKPFPLREEAHNEVPTSRTWGHRKKQGIAS